MDDTEKPQTADLRDWRTPAGVPLLTDDEHEAVELAGRVACLLERIAGPDRSRDGDLAEMCAAIHTVQNAVLAQAAARAYPDRYRLMGASPVQRGAEFFRADGTRVLRHEWPSCCDPTLMARSASPWTCPHGVTWRLGVEGDPDCWTPDNISTAAQTGALTEWVCDRPDPHAGHPLPRGTQVSADGGIITAPAPVDANPWPAERCRDPWQPEAHPPHNWRPADDPAWRYCDGAVVVTDGDLTVRRCRNNTEHRPHRWGTRLEDPPVPAGLASDAPTLAWCPGLTLELKAPPEPDDLVRRLPEPDIFDRDHWRNVAERASAVAVGAGAPDDGATLPEQVEWLAQQLHGPTLRPGAVRPLGGIRVSREALGLGPDLLPYVIEAEPGSTGEGVARTLRAMRWDCFDRVQLDRRAVELVLEALADREASITYARTVQPCDRPFPHPPHVVQFTTGDLLGHYPCAGQERPE